MLYMMPLFAKTQLHFQLFEFNFFGPIHCGKSSPLLNGLCWVVPFSFIIMNRVSDRFWRILRRKLDPSLQGISFPLVIFYSFLYKTPKTPTLFFFFTRAGVIERRSVKDIVVDILKILPPIVLFCALNRYII